MVRPVNSPLRQAMFGLGVLGLGLGGAPLIGFASMVSPSIVPTCIGLTGAIFGGASLMAYNMKKDSMLKYSGVLFGSLLGLIGLQLGGLLSAMIIGPNVFSMMMMNSSSYIAVGLFSAFILYDTHVAIKMYELGQPDHLGMATQFVLDIWNIFISLLRIFSNRDWWKYMNDLFRINFFILLISKQHTLTYLSILSIWYVLRWLLKTKSVRLNAKCIWIKTYY